MKISAQGLSGDVISFWKALCFLQRCCLHIDVGKVNAELKDGVLKLHLPKTEAAKPKTIRISAG
jgi:hypothetical protein